MENEITQELVNEVTQAITEVMQQLNRLPPRLREAAAMTAVMVLTERMLENAGDPHLRYMMLMTGMTDVYKTRLGTMIRTVQ